MDKFADQDEAQYCPNFGVYVWRMGEVKVVGFTWGGLSVVVYWGELRDSSNNLCSGVWVGGGVLVGSWCHFLCGAG